jgi:hypothetical protein
MSKLQTLLKPFNDHRVWMLIIPALAVLAIDMPVLMTLTYALAAMLVVAGVSHITMKIMFPYIDRESLAENAEQTPEANATVFLGMAIVLSSLIVATSIWIAH